MLQIFDLWKQINQQSLQNVKKLIYKTSEMFCIKQEEYDWTTLMILKQTFKKKVNITDHNHSQRDNPFRNTVEKCMSSK
jgi:hypothetical protein